MKRYLLEVPHSASKKSCELAVSIFHSTGSHFLTNADFGCHDGVHKAWIVAEANNKTEAKRIVPTPFRDKVKVVMVEKLALDNIEKHNKDHK